jgi:nifR3 family TIM-barrel protein
MKISPLSIANIKVDNNVFLAPMAGYTDFAFRKMAIPCGYGLTFTELVSAKGLMYQNPGNNLLLKADGDYDKTAVQIFGGEEYYLRSACESDYLKPFKIVDINMGCPVPKVYKNGEGSALLGDIKKAERIIKECVKSGKIITVKIRIGLKKGDDFATDFAKMAEDAGASLITIHGRVREDYYSGEPNYNAIYNAKKSVKIPVIANGGIFTKDDADKMMQQTGADGIMIARGGIANPFLVSELIGIESHCTLKEFMLGHVSLMAKTYADRRAALEFRKFVPYYFKGMNGLKDIKLQIYSAESTDKIIEILKENL